MKQVLIYSIQSEHVLNFLNGLKTIEVRKRDLPQWAKEKIDRGEVVQGYAYCTKGKPYLINHPYHSYMLIDEITFDNLNGLVVVKFEVSGVKFSDLQLEEQSSSCFHGLEKNMPINWLSWREFAVQCVLKGCITQDDLLDYVGDTNKIYAHHFTNIQPVHMELGEFYSIKANKNNIVEAKPLKRALQSFGTVYHVGKN